MTPMIPALRALCVAAALLGVANAGSYPSEVAAVIAAATAAGLPTTLLEDKAREAMAKGIPPAVAAGVLSGLAADLAEARRLLGPPGDDGATCTAAAVVLRGGGSPVSVRRIAGLPIGVRARALFAFADLLSLHVPEVDALSLVEDVASSAESAVGVEGLAGSVGALLAGGMSEADALASVRGAARPAKVRTEQGNHGNNGNNRNNGNNGNNGNGNGNGGNRR